MLPLTRSTTHYFLKHLKNSMALQWKLFHGSHPFPSGRFVFVTVIMYQSFTHLVKSVNNMVIALLLMPRTVWNALPDEILSERNQNLPLHQGIPTLVLISPGISVWLDIFCPWIWNWLTVLVLLSLESP